MKKILNTHQWIILLATLSMMGIGLLQAKWIYEGHRLKQEEINLQLKTITPEIAKELKNRQLLLNTLLLKAEEPIPTDSIDLVIDSMMRAQNLSEEYYYAIFQNKKDGIFKSSTEKFESELKSSEFKTCISCIVTFNFVQEKIDIDTITEEGLKAVNHQVRPAMTTIRSLEQTLKIDGKSQDDILWFALHVPNQFILAIRAIFSQLVLTILLMGLLMGLFIYSLRALAKQKKLSQVKDDFFNNMTHEFKTPLSSIRLASAVLKKQNVEESKKEIYLNLIENESKKLEGQVDKILELSLIESNEMTLEKENIDIHFLIEEVIDRLKIIIEQKEAIITLSLEVEDFSIKGDTTHLSNCIYNLIENALKYSGDFPKITIATFSENGNKLISVKDEGEGIPKEFQREIFDRFFRAQKNDQYKGKGFGIGLSYVKAIVEAHKGKIILNDSYKNGCEFVIAF